MAVVVPILSKWDPKGVRDAEQELDKLGRSIGNFAKTAAVGIGVGAAALGGFAVSAIKAAEEAQVENQRIEAIAKSMNLFGDQTSTVVKRMDEYASSVERATAIDGGQIKEVQAKLLTFEELARSADTVGGSFDRATKAALDLEKAGFGDASSNAVQLGKALQDPIKGLTALTRSGVTFTEEQQDLIKEMVRTNRTAEAQDMILGAIERQVGGTAEATATSSAKMAVAFEQVKEAIGIALLPLFERLTNWVVDRLVPAFQEWWAVNGPKVIEFLGRLAEWIGKVVEEYLPKFIQYVKDSWTELKNWWSEQETLQGWLEQLGTWLQENPDKLRDLAVAFLLVAAGIKAAMIIGSFVESLKLLLGFIGGGSAALGAMIAVAFALAEAWNWFTDKLLDSENVLLRILGYMYKIGGYINPAIGPATLARDVGEWFFGATGGIVTQPTLAMIGEAGPEAVVPLSSAPGASPLGDLGGGGGGINITVNGAIDPVSVANQINRILQQRGYRNGVLT